MFDIIRKHVYLSLNGYVIYNGYEIMAGFDRESKMKSCKALCTGYCSDSLEDENNKSFPAGQH